MSQFTVENHPDYTEVKGMVDYDSFTKQFYNEDDFTPEQIEFLNVVRLEYLHLREDESFDYDSWERDLWYRFNRSEEFKDWDFGWSPSDTRRYITE